jgi:hypothetical protein
MRVEPIDSGESGYRPPSREWLKGRRAKRLSFEHLLDEEIEKTPFMRAPRIPALVQVGARSGAADGEDA